MRYKPNRIVTMKSGEWGVWDTKINNWYIDTTSHKIITGNQDYVKTMCDSLNAGC